MFTPLETNAGGKLLVTICGTFGTNVPDIGAGVADLLGIPLHGATSSLAAIRSTFAMDIERDVIDQFLCSLRRDPAQDPSAVLSPDDRVVLSDVVARNKRLVMRQALEGGVLINHHAAWILQDLPHAFHVRIDSPLEERIRATAVQEGFDDRTASVLQDVEDKLRVQVARYSYGYDPERLDMYDVVLNTARFGVAEAAQLIAAQVRRRMLDDAAA